MAANNKPIFTLYRNIGHARVAAANTARDGSGTVVTLVTAATDGTRIDRITISSAQAVAATSSAMVATIYESDASGANYRLYKQVAIATATPSTTAIGATATINISGGLILKSGQLLGCTISVYASAADQMDFIAEAGDFS